MLDIVVLSLLHLLDWFTGDGSTNTLWFTGDGSTNTLYGTNQYAEYTPGNINLIITVPHDGFIHPTTIPNRTDGCRDEIGGTCQYPWTEDCPSKGPRTDDWYCRAVTYSDTFTQEIGRGFIREFEALTGKRPHIVLDNLHRSKMDPNREISRAAQGNPEAEKAYKEFHDFILEARAAIEGPGLLVDFHGMTHSHEKIEIGYLYKPKDLNAGDYGQDVSSMASFMTRTGTSVPELLSGPNSLGSLLEREGYPSIPSPRQPVPGEDKYYRGGWITQIHGSRDGGEVDALQIEMPLGIREGLEAEREEFTKKLAKVIREGLEAEREVFTKKLAKVIREFHQRYYTV